MQIYGLPIWIVSRPKGSSGSFKLVAESEYIVLPVGTCARHRARWGVFIDWVRKVWQFCDLPGRVHGIEARWGFTVYQFYIRDDRISSEQDKKTANEDDNG